MWKSVLLVPAVLVLVGCSSSKTASDAGKLIEARNPNCLAVDNACGLQIGPDGTELRVTLPDGSHLSIFAGLRDAAGDYVDACVDRAGISGDNWISGGKRGNVAVWVPLRSCPP